MKLRRWWILGLFAFFVLPSWAVKQQTVAQLEQTLISVASARKTDNEIAHQVGQTELSERISAATFGRLNKLIEKYPHAVVALQLLADASSFLPLRANELLSIPSPDLPKQQRQLETMRKYAFGIVPRLPNLLATRTTYSFDDSAREPEKGGWFERGGLNLVSTSKVEASVVAERENRPVKEAASLHSQNGLVTWGEFGSVLLLILNDSAHGTILWSHWEQGATAPISVFDYSVPKSESHYQITTPVEELRSGGGSSRWWAAGGMVSMDVDSGSKLLRSRPAYTNYIGFYCVAVDFESIPVQQMCAIPRRNRRGVLPRCHYAIDHPSRPESRLPLERFDVSSKSARRSGSTLSLVLRF